MSAESRPSTRSSPPSVLAFALAPINAIMTTLRKAPARRARRTGLARATRLARYLVEDAVGIIADLGYEIRDRVQSVAHRRRRGRSRTSTR